MQMGNNNFERPFVQTFTGGKFYFDAVEENAIVPEDLAHAASLMCRFNGHVREHYSVGQHELYASLLVRPDLALAALVHDSSETFVPDIASPLKAWLRMSPGWRVANRQRSILVLEKQIEAHIHSALGIVLTEADRDEIKAVDRRLAVTERRDLMPPVDSGDCWWSDEPYPFHIEPRDPWSIEEAWLHRFRALRSSRIHVW